MSIQDDMEGFQLPLHAPDSFRVLLKAWLDISHMRKPTPLDMEFKQLVPSHSGLATIEPIHVGSELQDLRYIQVGPDYSKKIGIDPTGLRYSDFVHPNLFTRCIHVFGEAHRTGRPHYWEIESTAHGYPSSSYERLLLPLHDMNKKHPEFLINCVWRDP